MRKEGIIGGSILLVAIVLLLRFSPGDLTLFIVGIMCALIAFGFFVGFVRIMNFSKGFVNARAKIERSLDVQTDSPWRVILEDEELFYYQVLDKQFLLYKKKAMNFSKDNDTVIGPIEEIIDDDFISLTTWNSLLVQIPSTLTGLGILGTFLGLIVGMNGMGFSSVTSAMGSITVMLDSIHLAFYTSIAGVILSILFNLIYHTIWEMMLQERSLFIRDFHQYVIPKTEEQVSQKKAAYMQSMLEKLEVISCKLSEITSDAEKNIDEDNC